MRIQRKEKKLLQSNAEKTFTALNLIPNPSKDSKSCVVSKRLAVGFIKQTASYLVVGEHEDLENMRKQV